MRKFTTKLRTKRNKEEFTSRMNETIKLRTMLIDFYNKVYCPMLGQQFNGKVLNKRLITAINKAGETMPTRIVCHLNDSMTEIIFEVEHIGNNYRDVETLYTKIFTNDEGRIMAHESLNDKLTLAWLKNFKQGTKQCAKCIDNYDEYLKFTTRLHNLIQEYGSLPSPFRFEGVDCNSFSTYLLAH
jgi:hypothetical protein